MTWQGKRRKQLPSNWGQIRKQVLERDGYRCTATLGDRVIRCGQRATEVHHLNGPLDHRLTSLASICHPHHQAETQAEAQAAAAKARVLNPPVNLRLRPTTQHPGLMHHDA